MAQSTKHAPLIVLYDDGFSGLSSIKEWFEQSRFRTWEALNAFDALEAIADFTVRNRPDVMLLRCKSASGDMEFIRTLMENVPGAIDVPIFALSDAKKASSIDQNLAGISARLEELIPPPSTQAH